MNQINTEQMLTALQETVYMTFVSLICAVILGLVIGTLNRTPKIGQPIKGGSVLL